MLDKIKNAAEVAVSEVTVTAARESIVKYSKELEADINEIQKTVDKIKDYWESKTAENYQREVTKRIEEIRTAQGVLNSNLEKYFSEIVETYRAVGNIVQKNAEMFK